MNCKVPLFIFSIPTAHWSCISSTILEEKKKRREWQKKGNREKIKKHRKKARKQTKYEKKNVEVKRNYICNTKECKISNHRDFQKASHVHKFCWWSFTQREEFSPRKIMLGRVKNNLTLDDVITELREKLSSTFFFFFSLIKYIFSLNFSHRTCSYFHCFYTTPG